MSKSRVLKTQPNHITRGFGNGHSGVDLGWDTIQNDAILAHSDGTVVFCQTGHVNNQGSTGNASYGNCVKLDHGRNMFTLYAHLSKVTVIYGQKVKKGQIIGYMGNTGNSYGSHLHFEVRQGASNCIDPAPYIAADLPGIVTQKEEPELTEAQIRAIVKDEIKKAMPAVYETVGTAPEWSRQELQEAMDLGIVKGTGNGRLDMNVTEIKSAMMAKRVYEKLAKK